MKTPNYGRILDTRDLAKRKEELESLRDALIEAQNNLEELNRADAPEEQVIAAEEAVESAETDYGSDEYQELSDLENAESEVPEWSDGATLIPRGDWVDYVKEMLEDCGDIPRNIPHYIEIDWDKTADNIEADYSEIEIQGTTYLYRNC